jgi:thiamine-phosphate pyrophosphorylase
MSKFLSAGLYFVLSPSSKFPNRSVIDLLKASLSAGVKLVQLRLKNVSDKELFEYATLARKLTDSADALLIINDRVDIAMAVKADGVHLGQNDLPATIARQLAPELIIGVSTHSVDEAKKAQLDGASYVNIGPLFPTKTKLWDKEFLGIEGLKRISSVINIPFTVMGGIKKEHIPLLVSVGACTIAVVTAITEADNPEKASGELLTEIEICKKDIAKSKITTRLY